MLQITGGAPAGSAGYPPAADPVPMPQQQVQLNLKVPATVAADWRARAAAGGFSSVREWLLATVGGPAAGDEPLTLQSLDRRLRALEGAPAGPVVPSMPRPAATSSQVLPRQPGDHLTTAELAAALGRNRTALNRSACAGQVIDGWRPVGRALVPGGGPPRWLWAPVADG